MNNSRYKSYSSAEAVPTKRILQHPTKPNVFYPIHHRPMRHAGVNYANARLICFVTFNVKTECGLELVNDLGHCTWDALRDEVARIGCRVYAACLMPDHVHLLLSPSGNGESISDIIRRIKTRCCTAIRQEYSKYLLWQTSFYDHILTTAAPEGDEFQAIIHYIITNPIRDDLGDEYPFRLNNPP